MSRKSPLAVPEPVQSQELAILTEIADIFTRQTGYLDKINRLLEVLARAVQADSASLRKPDAEESYLRPFASWGQPVTEGDFDLAGSSPRLMAVEAYVKSAAVVVNEDPDTSGSPRARLPLGVASGFALPIKSDESILAILSFVSSRPGHFTDSRVQFLTTISNSVSALLQNASLQEEREIEDNIAGIINSRLDIDDAYERFAAEAAKVFDFDRIGVYALDPQEGKIDVQFLQGVEVPGFLPGPGLSYEGSILGETVETGEQLMFHHDDPEMQSTRFKAMAPLLEAGFRSFIGIPLKSGNRYVGAFGLSTKSSRYTEFDLARAVRIGGLLATAVEGFQLRATQSRIQSDLAESENRLRQIADSIDGTFWLVEVEPTKLIYVSPGYEALWGRGLNDMSEDWREWYKDAIPEDQESYREELRVNLPTGKINAQLRIELPDGSLRWLSMRGFPIWDLSGRLYRVGGITVDITEQKENTARLAETERLASIGELSAGMAHEINNPLAAVIMYSESLLANELAEDVRRDINVVQSSAKRAARIVRNLLLFSRRSAPEKQLHQLDALVEASIAIMAEEFRFDDVEIVNDIPDDLPPVFVDDVQIIEVLLNVLNNARQACLSVNRPCQITLSGRTIDSSLEITIQDNGPGIPEGIKRRIFEPFFTTNEVGAGTGLGLSLSFGVIARHGGDIRVESEEGKGATFVIELPLSNSQKGIESRSPRTETPQMIAPNKRVLVVDDEPILRDIITRQLVLHNCIVDEASDGLEALQKIRALQYDCILLDLKMSGMDGRELHQQLLDHHSEMAARVIFMSGDTINPDTQGFLDELPNPVLEKPFDSSDLLGHLARMIDQPSA